MYGLTIAPSQVPRRPPARERSLTAIFKRSKSRPTAQSDIPYLCHRTLHKCFELRSVVVRQIVRELLDLLPLGAGINKPKTVLIA